MCPTCDHTMEALPGDPEDEHNTFHCPRCGTVKITFPEEDATVYVPKLVERCREFEGRVLPSLIGTRGEYNGAIHHEWKRIGLAESINPPGKRPGEESR